jgi:hypothetical protein
VISALTTINAEAKPAFAQKVNLEVTAKNGMIIPIMTHGSDTATNGQARRTDFFVKKTMNVNHSTVQMGLCAPQGMDLD